MNTHFLLPQSLINAFYMFLLHKKLDFIVVGVTKSGTTTLDSYLRIHPDINLPYIKEIHFFDMGYKSWKKVFNYAPLHAYFSIKRKKTCAGEITPGYMFEKKALLNIHAYNPDIKIIAILRNPITRAYSQWNMAYTDKKDCENFNDAIALEPIRIKKKPLQYSYIARGFYCDQIQQIWSLFPRENTLFIKFDDFVLQPQKTLDTICSFLDITKHDFVEQQWSRKGAYDHAMSEQEFSTLRHIFYDEIRNLEMLLSWDCEHWLNYHSINNNGVML